MSMLRRDIFGLMMPEERSSPWAALRLAGPALLSPLYTRPVWPRPHRAARGSGQGGFPALLYPLGMAKFFL